MPTDTSERGLERFICTELTGSTCDPGVVPDEGKEGKGSQLLTSLFRVAVYMSWNGIPFRGGPGPRFYIQSNSSV